MCEASNWNKIHCYICVTCYLLCVFFDVHLHGVSGAPKQKFPPQYDAVSGVSSSNKSNKILIRSCNYSAISSSLNSSVINIEELIERFIVPLNESKEENSSASQKRGLETFDKFLKSIHLGKVVEETVSADHHDHDHDNGHHHHDHENDHDDDHDVDKISKSPSSKPTTAMEYTKAKCLTAEDYYEALKFDKSCLIKGDQFKEICPTLIYQLAEKSCIKSPKTEKKSKIDTPSLQVWGCCIAAVIIISLVGLGAVALIPLMTKDFYDILVQFLIAVGVGTLVGDAILHLIPHALVPHDHTPGSESQALMRSTMWKSLMALAGIHLFFLTERLTTMIQSYRIRKRLRRRRTRLLDQSSAGNCPDDGTVAIIQPDSRFSNGDRNIRVEPGRTSISNDSSFDLGKLVPATNSGHNHSHNQRSDCNVVAEEANRLMHQTPVHHCHSHDFSSIKAIAWTVIMGDGLHNFCDGVAIGAAFADDLRGGLSTSVAVIWHELPHEIGDFAVLLKAGMSVKMAVFYNILSSIFCFAGMVIGIMVGGMHNVTPWVFMLATGMFVYIALVDMLPNLTCDQVDENGQPTADGTKSHPKLVFLIQNLGILTGYAVMLLIALYEDKIMS